MSISITPNLTSAPRSIPIGAWVALLLAFALVYVGAMWTPGILDDADGTHAEAAREMAASNDFVTLKVNGVRYLEKPVLTYWMAAVSIKVFGENEFAVRFPSALGILLSMLFVAHWANRAFGVRAGIFAGLFTVTGVGSFLFTRTFIPEVWLSLLIALSLYLFLTALELPDGGWRWYAGYASLGLAVLAKGLVALVFAGGTIFLYLIATGDWRRWREFRFLTGSLLMFAIAAPWHILAGLRNTGGMNGHGFFWFYFINEHVLRFLGKRIPRDYNKLPALVYWTAHLAWLFPWSLFLPEAIKHAWHEWRDRRNNIASGGLGFAQKTTLMCSIYALLILVFFAISTNQEYYTFPVYIPLFILIAVPLAAAGEKEELYEDYGRPGRASFWIMGSHVFLAAFGVAIAVALSSGLWSSRNMPYVADIGTVLARRGVGEYTLSMSQLFDLTGESFAALRLPAMIAAFAMLAGPVTALVLRKRKHHFAATWAIGITAAIFLFAAHTAMERFDPFLSSKKIAARLQVVIIPEDKMMIFGDQANGSSLLFYLKRPIILVNGNKTSMMFGSTFPDVPKIFLDDEGLKKEWQSSTRVFMFVSADHVAEAKKVLGENMIPVFESGEKLVFSNRK